MKDFKVTKDNKTLWHIQDPTCEWSDQPIDMFIFSKTEPTQDRIKQEIIYELGYDKLDDKVNSILDNCNTYVVYAT